MSNVSTTIQLLDLIQKRATKGTVTPSKDMYEIFEQSIHKTIVEIKDGADSDDFSDLVVINLLIEAAQQGHDTETIRKFVERLTDDAVEEYDIDNKEIITDDIEQSKDFVVPAPTPIEKRKKLPQLFSNAFQKLGLVDEERSGRTKQALDSFKNNITAVEHMFDENVVMNDNEEEMNNGVSDEDDEEITFISDVLNSVNDDGGFSVVQKKVDSWLEKEYGRNPKEVALAPDAPELVVKRKWLSNDDVKEINEYEFFNGIKSTFGNVKPRRAAVENSAFLYNDEMLEPKRLQSEKETQGLREKLEAALLKAASK